MQTLGQVQRKRNTMCRKSRRAFANDFSVLQPTLWANEAIIQLLPNMVTGQLVARDFDNQVSRFGDIVNAFIPSTFEMTRKGALCDNIVVQDATGSRVQVPLNQWPQVSFLICDGEENRDQLDLIDALLTPGVIALAQGVDRILNSQVYQFIMGSAAGLAGGVDSTNIRQYLLETREAMNRNKVPLPGRTLMLTPGTETEALQVDGLTFAEHIADMGDTMREAALGRKYGFDIFMSQTQPEVVDGQTRLTGGSIACAAAAKGATTVTLSGGGIGSSGANLVAGQWIVIAGDSTPQQITVANVGASAGVCTIQPGLRRAVAGASAVIAYAPLAINNSGGYNGTTLSPRVIGWAKEILIDGGNDAAPPQIGQMVTFGTDTLNKYAIIKLHLYGSGEFGIELDTPLVLSVANNQAVNLGPAAKYNFAFLRNAFTFVNRPLPEPRTGTGTIAKTVIDPVNRVSLRVTISYDHMKQGHLVTLDTLMGVGVLSSAMGVPMFA